MNAKAAPDGVAFDDIQVERPQLDAVATAYRELHAGWEKASDAAERVAVFRDWDALRRRVSSWSAYTRLRFDQDTSDADRKAEIDYLDDIAPKLARLETDFQRTLLASAHRSDLERALGAHVLKLWEADVATFAQEIESDLTRESNLETTYTELIAGANLAIDGEHVNLAGLEPYLQKPDREARHQAQLVRDAFFTANGAELDRIYDELVRLRHTMARALGFDDFIGLGYKRMHRIDYDRADVERYRDQVARDIVPIAAQIIERRRAALGIDQAMFWDEPMADAGANPAPQGDAEWIVAQGAAALSKVHPEIGGLFRMMVDRGLVDLRNREHKAGGGYCTSFPDYGVPYVFANFNGTHGDVHVLVHEMGHAFQDWQSRYLPALDYLTPTMETAEIHSMSMEYLAAPHMEAFFGSDAERYRHQHLEDALLFLPYGVAVDHFQHLVYAAPESGPAERHAMWQRMEARYLPWRRYGDLAYFARGGLWQAKPHIYQAPFYYIDYTLALCCALQFWARSRREYQRAVDDYIALCRRGGQAAFLDLVRSANLASPFDGTALERVVEEARSALSLA
ncbi:MAG: M3 family oligoendopeptidase [Candidatus Eremiobacteraeota bacterium]|nr:M3 family oligoendopeptidase [Candidatus Eremiobacteraeota bacterium]